MIRCRAFVISLLGAVCFILLLILIQNKKKNPRRKKRKKINKTDWAIRALL